MVRPLRRYHRILWIVLSILLPIGFVIAFLLSGRLEQFYMKDQPARPSSIIEVDQVIDHLET